MGVGFKVGKHEAWWAYSGFGRFRRRLAHDIGVALDEMKGFKEDGNGTPWGLINDDLVPFLNHSDCEGYLGPKNCRKVAKRIRAIVGQWPMDSDKRNALELASAMELSAKTGKKLEFR